MAAQLAPGESRLYSFMPSALVKGGSAVVSPPPLPGPRRQRNSLSDDTPIKLDDKSEPATQDLLVSPRSLSSLPTSGRTSTSGASSGAARGSSADRYHLASSPGGGGGGGSVMPLLVGSVDKASAAAAAASTATVGGAGAGLGPNPRQSLNGPVGLPKLDLPCLGGGGGGGTELPSRSSLAVRRSLNGTPCDLPPSLDGLAVYGSYDFSAPASPPRQGTPTVLAPLRGTFGCPPTQQVGAAGGGPNVNGTTSLDGWCVSSNGSGGGGSGGLVYNGSRRFEGAAATVGSPLMSYDSSCVPTPLTPSAPPTGLPGGPPRRSHSLTLRGPGSGGSGGNDGGRLSIDLVGGALGGGGSRSSSAAEADHGDPNGAAAGAVTTIAMLAEVNDDLRRTCDALLSLHAAPGGRSRPGSASARVGIPVTSVAVAGTLTMQQLAALRESAPELHTEVRSAVRRAFLIMRQALGRPPSSGDGGCCSSSTSCGGGAVTAATPPPLAPPSQLSSSFGERRLGQCVHECWATLDALLESTAGLTSVMVGELLSSRHSSSGSLGLQPFPPSQPSPRQQQQPLTGLGILSGRASSVAEWSPTEGSTRELEQLRATNQDLQRQLEECRALLAKAEVRAAAAETAAVAAAAALPLPVSSGTCPRPPGAAAAVPPGNRCPNTSPRLGKLARAHSQREDAADGGGGSDDVGVVFTGASSPASSCEPSVELLRRFDRAAVLARGPSYREVVIEEDDSEDDLDDAANPDVRRAMLTIHSASFAEWVRGAGSWRR